MKTPFGSPLPISADREVENRGHMAERPSAPLRAASRGLGEGVEWRSPFFRALLGRPRFRVFRTRLGRCSRAVARRMPPTQPTRPQDE